MSQVGFRLIRQLSRQIPGVSVRLTDRLVKMPGGGEVRTRSADNPDSLRGEGLDFVVLDECAFMKEEAWSEALRPSLSDRGGSAMFISTPKGRNWFWRLWQMGQDFKHGWASYHFPTSDNPYIPDEEIEAARAGLPERIFRQEYLAEFIDDAGGVFRRVMEAATAEGQDKAIDGHTYVMGVDWGRHHDFTVVSVYDVTTQSQAALDRFTQIDYGIQISRLKAMAGRFRPTTIVAELNAMGEPLVEQLLNAGLPVQGFMTTNKTKEQVIRGLEGAFERNEIRILNDPVQVGELQAYEQERLLTGWRFNAPAGMHDDTVIGLALAYHAGANSWLSW